MLVDTGNQVFAATNHERIRGWDTERLHTTVFTHGHIDHVFGLAPFEEEAEGKGWALPHVVAHELLPGRFDRYLLTAGYNGVINQRQFQFPKPYWPTEYRYPDELYRDQHTLTVGGETWELHHDKGETDDATWVWNPDRKVLCTGDLFIWASPNCGNPQKVQRYPREWAIGLRKMAALGAEVLLPGHGFPIIGADRIALALGDTAELLESLVDQTLELMNAGARLDDIVHTVQAPAAPPRPPYLRPVYDEPEFVVRNLWRLYGGWYDGNPAHLKPATDAALADGGGGPRRRRRCAGRAGPRSWPTRATCAWPVTWPRWRRWPRPTTSRSTRSEPRCSAPEPPRSAPRCPRASSAGPSGRARPRPESGYSARPTGSPSTIWSRYSDRP